MEGYVWFDLTENGRLRKKWKMKEKKKNLNEGIRKKINILNKKT